MDPLITFMIVAVAGIGSQWLAWRWQVPAIVLMLLAGIFVGPVTGLVDPMGTFGDLLAPIVGLAVALILFEGGLTLNFQSISGAENALRRLVYVAGPLVWLLATLAAHYIGGLSWASASIIGGIMIVTGPTVVTPLLRQAGLKRRPAEILRWEAIVNDPIGALAAVLAFEVVDVLGLHTQFSDALGRLSSGIFIALVAGFLGAQIIVQSFTRGWVPEYLKVPVMIVLVIVVYVVPDFVLHESGLLAVTVMGILLANAHLPSLGELRRFKEHITVILVSGVFVLLAANIQFSMLAALDWRAYAFVAALIFLIRPASVLISFIGTNLPMNERLMVGWIAPRGIVAVAVSGLFGVRLMQDGIDDGALLAPLAFVIVTATVFLHGFTIAPLARILDLRSTAQKGLLLMGSGKFVLELARLLIKQERPVLVADRNWFRLRDFRAQDIPVYYGEILSEDAEYDIDFNVYSDLLALTDNDDYNALVCADFAPEMGRGHVFQYASHRGVPDGRKLPNTLGGRYLQKALSFDDTADILAQGGRLAATKLSEEFTLEHYQAQNPDAIPILAIPKEGDLRVLRNEQEINLTHGEKLVALLPKPEEPEEIAIEPIPDPKPTPKIEEV